MKKSKNKKNNLDSSKVIDLNKEDLMEMDSLEDIEIEVSEEHSGDGEFNEAELEALNIAEEEVPFLTDAIEDDEEEMEAGDQMSMDGTELEAFDSAEILEREFVEDDRIISIVESVLFATEKPLSLAAIKHAFKGTQVKTAQIRRALDQLMIEYAGAKRGVTLEEIAGGYQLRTKSDNVDYLKQMAKSRPFKLSGPALEVLSIVAYKQPCIKSEIDEIRGVESGHLMRALMEKSLVSFAGKSEHPGKPMLYQTTRKFLEIFGLRNIQELPSLSEIDELIPEGIGEEQEKETLGDLTQSLSQDAGTTYSEGEEELLKITDQLGSITTSSDFFEEEKRRQKDQRDRERARDIREALTVGETVETKDARWLERYDKEILEREALAIAKAAAEVSEVLAGEEAAAPPALSADQVETENLEGSADLGSEEALFEDSELTEQELEVSGALVANAENTDSSQDEKVFALAGETLIDLEISETSEVELEFVDAEEDQFISASLSEELLEDEESDSISAADSEAAQEAEAAIEAFDKDEEAEIVFEAAAESEPDLELVSTANATVESESAEKAPRSKIGQVDIAKLRGDLAAFEEEA